MDKHVEVRQRQQNQDGDKLRRLHRQRLCRQLHRRKRNLHWLRDRQRLVALDKRNEMIRRRLRLFRHCQSRKTHHFFSFRRSFFTLRRSLFASHSSLFAPYPSLFTYQSTFFSIDFQWYNHHISVFLKKTHKMFHISKKCRTFAVLFVGDKIVEKECS